MKVLATALLITALLGSSLACGQGDTQAAAQRVDLDRVIPRLPNGLSIDEVKDRLGEPQKQFEAEGGEIDLVYGLWEVVFHPSLYARSRHYLAAFRPDRPVAPLDRQIRALKLGSSRRSIEREMGKAEAWEILTLGSNERLWYGNGRWKLVLKDRRLSGRVLYQ